MRSTCDLRAPREWTNPRVWARDLTTAIPGYATSALPLAPCATVISMMFHRRVMEVHFHGKDVDIVVEVKEGDTVRTALQAAGVLPSMVIVSHDGTVLASLHAAESTGSTAWRRRSHGG